MPKFTYQVAILWVFSFCGTFAYKQLKLCLFCTKLCIQHNLVYIIVLMWLEFKIIVICQKFVLRCDLKGFFRFFSTFVHKVGQTCLFSTQLDTQHYLVYIIVLKLLELKIIVICQKLRIRLRYYGVFSFFAVSRIKQLKLGLFCTKLCIQ